MAKNRMTPIPDTIQSVPGYPATLKVYKVPASSYWQTRAWMDNRFVCRTTKTEIFSEAVKFARAFYNELLLKRQQGQPLTEGNSFQIAAEDLMKWDQSRVDRGERKQSLVDDCRYIYEKDLLPFFKRDHPSRINTKRIEEYVAHLQKRGLSSQTIKNHFTQLSKILKRAGYTPRFPTITIQDNPRDWFTDDEFAKLQKAIQKAIKDKARVRYTTITQELLELTNFMVNTFLRPQDVKVLRNRDVTIVKKPGKPAYLRIMAKGKVKASPVISTTGAVAIYERIKGAPDDYVFFKDYTRGHAMSTMSRQFRHCLDAAGFGAKHTLYSLRHTCVTNQLLHGTMPVALVARNCRTSIEMIERFYGSHAEAEKNVHQLYQPGEAGDTLEDFFDEDALRDVAAK